MQDRCGATPIRTGKRREEEDGDKSTGVAAEHQGTLDDDATPRQAGNNMGQGLEGTGSSQSSASHSTCDLGSLSSSVKRRRRAQGLALASATAPRLAYFDDPGGNPPELLQALARELQDIDVEKHFAWPELQVCDF